MKTSSSRTKGSGITIEDKREGRRMLMLFPFILGMLAFVIDGMLSFYTFWNSGLGMSMQISIGLTFASIGFSIFIVLLSYFAMRKRY